MPPQNWLMTERHDGFHSLIRKKHASRAAPQKCTGFRISLARPCSGKMRESDIHAQKMTIMIRVIKI